MKRTLLAVPAALAAAAAFSITAIGQAPAAGTTVYEGARVIVGDGSAPIDNAAFVVDGGRITQVGPAGQVKAPAGAARVNLAGKTVMPAIIDTHTHMGDSREAVIALVQRGLEPRRGPRRFRVHTA
jgi:imidazolonepropionase-like amidohydrolase